jgi:hypothetical protein
MGSSHPITVVEMPCCSVGLLPDPWDSKRPTVPSNGRVARACLATVLGASFPILCHLDAGS